PITSPRSPLQSLTESCRRTKDGATFYAAFCVVRSATAAYSVFTSPSFLNLLTLSRGRWETFFPKSVRNNQGSKKQSNMKKKRLTGHSTKASNFSSAKSHAARPQFQERLRFACMMSKAFHSISQN